jgi:Sec-independent protein translocase protein TatA
LFYVTHKLEVSEAATERLGKVSNETCIKLDQICEKFGTKFDNMAAMVGASVFFTGFLVVLAQTTAEAKKEAKEAAKEAKAEAKAEAKEAKKEAMAAVDKAEAAVDKAEVLCVLLLRCRRIIIVENECTRRPTLWRSRSFRHAMTQSTSFSTSATGQS